MRINQPITDREKGYHDDQRIVSTTNVKGVLTSINKDFIDISGFTEEELIGQAHNLVRHPSMPQIAFKELWDHNKAHKPWMGMVKNRCKNGDHYWVSAFVTPILEDGKVSGYQSVRQKPSIEHVKRAEDLYQKKNNVWRWLSQRWGATPFNIRLFVVFSLANLGALAFSEWSLSAVLIASGLLVSNGIISFYMAKPWMAFAKKTESLFFSPIARPIYSGRHDELGQLQLAFEFLESQKDTILYRTQDVAEQVQLSANRASKEVRSVKSEIDTLYDEVTLAATATEEMTATIQEVARNAAATSRAADESKQNIEYSRKALTTTKSAIDDLMDTIDSSSTIIGNLNNESTKIGSVVDVISSIAEQTNLLALNAAIEAARAGEQGRGFAVVADEVRALAGKTQESTSQISHMIQSLQNSAGEAVNTMSSSHEKVKAGAGSISQLEEQFATTLENVNTMSDMCIQIATATEEQSSVAEEINLNINNINRVGQNTVNSAEQAAVSNNALTISADELHNMITQFKG